MTQLRKKMLEELQGRKSFRLPMGLGLRTRRFNAITEAPELSNHLPRAQLLGAFGDRRSAFLITNSLMQNQPDQPTLAMGNNSDRLIVSQAGDRATIHDLEDASFGPSCSIRRLIEYASHLTVALGRAVAVVYARSLVVAVPTVPPP